MRKEYWKIPSEIRLVLFDLERVFALEVGGGAVFDKSSKREVSDTRHAFIYIANLHYGFSQDIVCEWIHVRQGIVFNAKKKVAENIRFNIMYRNRLFNVAVDNGIMSLIYEISGVADKN